MIRAIIFDCFGVLTTDRWREFSATLPEDALAESRKLMGGEYNTGRIAYPEFSKRLQAITGHSKADIDEVFLRTDFAKNEALLHYIAKLKSSYKIGLLSNVAGDRVRQYVLSTDDQKLFDDMVFSFDVGMTKPDQRVFELACKRLEVAPSEAVMVDDTKRHLEGAQQIGMQAVQYQDFPQFKCDLNALLADSNN